MSDSRRISTEPMNPLETAKLPRAAAGSTADLIVAKLDALSETVGLVRTDQIATTTRLSQLEAEVRDIKHRERKRDDRVGDARKSASEIEVRQDDLQQALIRTVGDMSTSFNERFDKLQASEDERAKAEAERAHAAKAQAASEAQIAKTTEKSDGRLRMLVRVGIPVAAGAFIQVIRGLKELGFWDWLGHALHVLGG